MMEVRIPLETANFSFLSAVSLTSSVFTASWCCFSRNNKAAWIRTGKSLSGYFVSSPFAALRHASFWKIKTYSYSTKEYNCTTYCTMSYNTILYRTIYTIQYHTILYHTIPYTIQYHSIQYHTIPYNTISYTTTQHHIRVPHHNPSPYLSHQIICHHIIPNFTLSMEPKISYLITVH
jgi:hypothetical protein